MALKINAENPLYADWLQPSIWHRVAGQLDKNGKKQGLKPLCAMDTQLYDQPTCLRDCEQEIPKDRF